MGNPLRDRRAAADWASAGQVIEITDKVGAFNSLSAVIAQDLLAHAASESAGDWRDQPVEVRLEFGFAESAGQVAVLSGWISTEVPATCQRCLLPFRLQLTVAPKLLLLRSDEEVSGYDDFEVWELDERLLKPQDVVDELLVMAWPFAPMHDNAADCVALDNASDPRDSEMTRPFAALREQMAKNDENSSS